MDCRSDDGKKHGAECLELNPRKAKAKAKAKTKAKTAVPTGGRRAVAAAAAPAEVKQPVASALPEVDIKVDVLFNLGPRRGIVRSHDGGGRFSVFFQEDEELWAIDPARHNFRAVRMGIPLAAAVRAPDAQQPRKKWVVLSSDSDSDESPPPEDAGSESSSSDAEEEEELFEVERVVNKRASREVPGTFEYKVKWKGYAETEMTWEPEENCAGDPSTTHSCPLAAALYLGPSCGLRCELIVTWPCG